MVDVADRGFYLEVSPREDLLVKKNWDRYADLTNQGKRTALEEEERELRGDFQNAYANCFNGDYCKNFEKLTWVLGMMEETLTQDKDVAAMIKENKRLKKQEEKRNNPI